MLFRSPDTTAAPRSVVQLYVSSGLPNVALIDLRQYSRDDAERYLRNAKLIPKTTLRYDAKAPKGVVLSQSPGPLAQVPMRSVVSLVVSNGQKPVAVPDLVDLAIGDAQSAAQKRGLQLEIGERVTSDNIPADVVVSQNPSAGSNIDPNSKVVVTVSAGAPMVGVPDSGGKSIGDALAAIRSAGLTARVTYDVDQSIPAGTVLQQDPAASGQAHKGSQVTLVVAVPGVVPDVVNMPLDQARSVLQDAGYSVGSIFYGEGGQPGNVVRAEPDPNTPLRPGSSVSLHVAGQSP